MRLTLIALLLAGVVGCDSEPDDRAIIRFEEPKPEAENGGEADSNAQADYELALKHRDAQEYVKAAKWYRKAAEQGHVEAQVTLGHCYWAGNGVPRDHAEAARWFRKVVLRGHTPLFHYATKFLSRIYRSDIGDSSDLKDDIEAYGWCHAGATFSPKDANEKLQHDQLLEDITSLEKRFTPEQLPAAKKRAAKLTEQINANKAK